MAVTIALAGRSRYGLAYLVSHDGNGANNVTRTSVEMRADLVAGNLGGPLLQLLQTFPRSPDPTSAEAHLTLLGYDPTPTAAELENFPHCRSWIQSRGTPASNWALVATAPGGAVPAGEIGLQIASAAVANTAVLYVQFQHTLNR